MLSREEIVLIAKHLNKQEKQGKSVPASTRERALKAQLVALKKAIDRLDPLLKLLLPYKLPDVDTSMTMMDSSDLAEPTKAAIWTSRQVKLLIEEQGNNPTTYDDGIYIATLESIFEEAGIDASAEHYAKASLATC